MYAVNDACYYYDLRFGSLTQKYRELLPKQYVNLYRSYMKFIENSHVRNKHIDEFQNMFLWQLIFGTCFPNEYRKTENHSVADGRVKIAFIFSISIEMLQLLLRLGTFQLSDIFYNTVGGVLGGLIYYGILDGIVKARKHL